MWRHVPLVFVASVGNFPVKSLNVAEIELSFVLLLSCTYSLDHDVSMSGGSQSLLPELCLQRKWVLIVAGISWGGSLLEEKCLRRTSQVWWTWKRTQFRKTVVGAIQT